MNRTKEGENGEIEYSRCSTHDCMNLYSDIRIPGSGDSGITGRDGDSSGSRTWDEGDVLLK